MKRERMDPRMEPPGKEGPLPKAEVGLLGG